MSLDAPPSAHARLIAHYAAVRARLTPHPPRASYGSAWHLDEGADDATRIRACVAVIAVGALEQGTPLSIGQIKRAVCRAFAVTWQEIESHRRGARLLTPRHIAMTLARRMTAHSLPEIGRCFGRRDHSTVRHAIGKWSAAVARAIADTG